MIELLVVISIVAVLAALSFTALGKALEKAHTIQCASNLRQIGIAFHAYWQDSNDVMPQRLYPSGPPAPGGLYGYDELLLPYVDGNEKIFQCPAHASPGYPTQPSYGMNWYYDNMPVGRIQKSSRLILAAESLGDDGTGSHRADRDSISPGQLDDQRHSGKANYLFFDGHVELLQKSQTLTPEDLWGIDGGQHDMPSPP